MKFDKYAYLLAIIVAALVVISIIVYTTRYRPRVTVIDQDTTIEGDFLVGKNETVILKDSAKVTVTGDLEIDGEMSCQKGTLNAQVAGNLLVNNKLNCNLDEAEDKGAIALAVSGSVVFDDQSIVVSNGSVQIVDQPEKLAGTQADINRIFEEIGQDTGPEPRIGPFVSQPAADETSYLLSPTADSSGISAWSPRQISEPADRGSGSTFFQKVKDFFAKTAGAQGPNTSCRDQAGKILPRCYQLSGSWLVGKNPFVLSPAGDGAPSTPLDQPPFTPSGPSGPANLNLPVPPLTGVYVAREPVRRVQVPTPPPGVDRIVVRVDVGRDGNANLQNLDVSGPDGRNGSDDIGQSCNARGANGENAFRFNVVARDIRINNFRLFLGNGGIGGEATTITDCNPGNARGGNGGDSGNFKMTALGDFVVAGDFSVFPGRGGDGGSALASGTKGQGGCPGATGANAVAQGGNGADNQKNLRAIGLISGLANITVTNGEGGNGGNAIAHPGGGGDGTSCGCQGGSGGRGTPTGGSGGDAAIEGPRGSLPLDGGGNGGDAGAAGATGGNGGQCTAAGPGGKGGRGGDVEVKPGRGGRADFEGYEGQVIRESGGTGGNGGDGCPQGGGGNPGHPNGQAGAPGKNLCPEEEEPVTVITPRRTIRALKYSGKFIPLDQVHQGSGPDCDEPHWHANEAAAKATDGTILTDPGGCGYGRVGEVPVVDVEI